jgi:hypothetical protein
MPAHIDPARARAIFQNSKKWVNGTELKYYFFDQQSDGDYRYYADGTREWVPWTADDDQKDAVRQAFDIWQEVGIGLTFKEVARREEAEIRIGFMSRDGAWSYVGRDILNVGDNKRTMNFGWDVSDDVDTCVHEIGHTLGMSHEHQNPFAGIVWDEEAVYAALAAPPNEWSRDTTYHNIIRKIDADSVQGSSWDRDSIMHYPFEAGMIKEPAQFRTSPLYPRPGLSERDKTWARTFYPPLDPQHPRLEAYRSEELYLGEGEQADFVIEPDATRKMTIQTFGSSDTVMVLFEDVNGELQYRSADDDSGQDLNARIEHKLIADQRYVLRIRLYWKFSSGRLAVMMWG